MAVADALLSAGLHETRIGHVSTTDFFQQIGQGRKFELRMGRFDHHSLSTMSAPPPHPLIELRDASFAGIRINFLPGVALWILGVAVILIYHFVDAAAPFFKLIGELKEIYGYLYSGVATAIFGGIIPFFYLRAAGRVPEGKVRSWFLFFLLFWTWRGIEVDAFYRLQDWLFGSSTDVRTIGIKVIVDQFVYCPLWASPVLAVLYAWKDVDFSFKRLGKRVNRRLFLFEIPSVLLSTWIVWIPAVALIYSLPLPLQIPLFNLVLCFFVLLVSVLAPPSQIEASPSGPAALSS